MKTLILALISLTISQRNVPGRARPTLSDGVITVPEGSHLREIRLGKQCSDLWVAPDDSAIAFIVVEKSSPPITDADHGDFIEESSVYIARRADDYKPVRVELRSVDPGGQLWNVFRSPTLSPDLKTVYFLVPNAATSASLFAATVVGGQSHGIRDVTLYCVIWGGSQSGNLLLQVREPSNEGIIHPCRIRTRTGTERQIADDAHCSESYFHTWSQQHGGRCPPPGDTQ